MKKLFVSLQDALVYILIEPTLTLPAAIKSGVLKDHSLTGVTFITSLLILYFTRSVELHWAFTMTSFFIVSAWWAIGISAVMVMYQWRVMYRYYTDVQKYVAEYIADGEAVPTYYLQDLQRIS